MTYKLYFRYGCMNSSKTANLLMIAHNYESQNKKVLVLKPSIDTRTPNITSRCGISRNVDIFIDNATNLLDIDLTNIVCLLVDEVQFLEEKHIEQLRKLTKYAPVICYGLKTDYRTILFPGSKRLIELADNIEEIKTICVECGKKSIINAKFFINDISKQKNIIKEGCNSIDIGYEEKYQAMCWNCWLEHEPLIL